MQRGQQFSCCSLGLNCIAALRRRGYGYIMVKTMRGRCPEHGLTATGEQRPAIRVEPVRFGAVILEIRCRQGRSQSAVSAAARLSPGYYCDLENSKRIAPPTRTAARIAQAFHLTAGEAAQLVALAQAERAASNDIDLEPAVRELIAAIRASTPRLRGEAIESMLATLLEGRT